MSAWGNKDDIASPGTVDISGLTVSNTAGQPTFFANNYAAGQVIDFGGFGSAVIAAIAGEGSLTIVSNTELTTGSATGIAYTVSEKPSYTVDTDTVVLANTVYGVSAAELSGTGGITSVSVTGAGANYTVRPTVTFSDTTGTGATATATVKVVTMAVANGGSGFTNGAVVQVGGGTGTSANATVSTNNNSTAVNSLTIVNAGSYTALPTVTNNLPSNFIGSGLRINLSMGVNAVTVSAVGSGYTAPTVVFANTGGTYSSVATATAVLQSSDRAQIAHAGWVKIGESYTDAQGNSRQKSEVLVAMSTITGDGDDDTGDVALPE
jgi:hypothetical protein